MACKHGMENMDSGREAYPVCLFFVFVSFDLMKVKV